MIFDKVVFSFSPHGKVVSIERHGSYHVRVTVDTMPFSYFNKEAMQKDP